MGRAVIQANTILPRAGGLALAPAPDRPAANAVPTPAARRFRRGEQEAPDSAALHRARPEAAWRSHGAEDGAPHGDARFEAQRFAQARWPEPEIGRGRAAGVAAYPSLSLFQEVIGPAELGPRPFDADRPQRLVDLSV